MNSLEVDVNRLRSLRERSTAVAGAIETHRAEVLRCIRETGEARVAGATEPDRNPAKDVEARCKKLDLQRLAAQAELDKLTPEIGPLAEAIKNIENGIGGKVHAQRLEKQGQVREAYTVSARLLLEAADRLAELSARVREIFNAARREFPVEEHSAGQEVVLAAAGLREIWDPTLMSGDQYLQMAVRRQSAQAMIWDRSGSILARSGN
jgi:hypothetical protein